MDRLASTSCSQGILVRLGRDLVGARQVELFV
jgi:hypothetical protein